MTQLIRTKTGPFTYKTWHSLQDLKDAIEFHKQGKETDIKKIILPFEVAVQNLPKILVHDSAVNTICHGSSLGIPGISALTADIKENDTVAVMTLKNELICLGRAVLSSEDMMSNDKGLAVVTDAVFMERNIYPQHNKQEL